MVRRPNLIKTNAMNQPLQGLRILDLTHMLAGPFATHQLRLLGATVVKVEAPLRGDAMRWGPEGPRRQLAADYVSINAGKKSVVIDLKDPRGRDLVLELTRDADVMVENFRPGVIESLGLGFEAVLRENPRIVYCSISGYGQDGPLREWPAYDHVLQALSGMAMMSGDEGQPPVKVGFPVVDTATGMSAATAILAALLRRERGGGGQHIDVSMLDTAATLMSTVIARCLESGVTPLRTGNRGYTGSPGCDTFATADGWIALGANTPAQFARLCGLLGIEHVLLDSSLVDPKAFVGKSNGFARARDAKGLRAHLAAALIAQPASHWEALLNRADVPAARLRTVSEFTEGPLQDVKGRVMSLPPMPGYPQGARTLNAGHRTRHDPPGFSQPCSLLGEDTREILRCAGVAETRIDDLIAAGIVHTDQSAPVPEGLTQ
jgi:crotonobetainyl-CoA:carnitine CoA-transferase CaiB-like acyl-CoA transferase